MLSPWAEFDIHERDLLPLMVSALRGWPTFATRFDLTDAALPRTGGTLLPALSVECEHRLARLVDELRRMGAPFDVIDRDACLRREPALSPEVRAGIVLPDEASVDNRAVLAQLRTRLRTLGVVFDSALESIDESLSTPTESSDDDDVVVWATGAWTAPDTARSTNDVSTHVSTDDVRPVHGMTARVHAPGVVRHVVRAEIDRRSLYLVPRDGGEVVIGAPSLDIGYDPTPRLGVVADLLGDASRVMPLLRDAELVSLDVGLRPVSRDGMPRVTPLPRSRGGPRQFAVTGLGRHGFLLAPWLARRFDSALSTLPTTTPQEAAC